MLKRLKDWWNKPSEEVAEVIKLAEEVGALRNALHADVVITEFVRYGRVPGPGLLNPCEDGYWTPWHIAQRRIASLECDLLDAHKEIEQLHQQAGDLRQDAERYRFIRDVPWNGTDLEAVIVCHLHACWDRAIDEAMGKTHNL